jgi:1-acyl-sn-glycerol-3-phosphate acyltransferase
MTIVGTHYAMPKARFAIKPGRVKVIFHPPIEPQDFGSREGLMEKVRAIIDSGLPAEYQQTAPMAAKGMETHGGTAFA